jgi:hypothetical protein
MARLLDSRKVYLVTLLASVVNIHGVESNILATSSPMRRRLDIPIVRSPRIKVQLFLVLALRWAGRGRQAQAAGERQGSRVGMTRARFCQPRLPRELEL